MVALGALAVAAVIVGAVVLLDGPAEVPGEVAVPAAPGGTSPTAADRPTDVPPSPSPATVPQVAPVPRPPLPEGWRLYEESRLSVYLPADWSVTTDPFVPEGFSPRDMLSVATFELGDVDRADGDKAGCPPPFPSRAIRTVGPDDVLVVFFTPQYVVSFSPPPPPFGRVTVHEDELEEARRFHSDSPGFCGNDQIIYLREVAAHKEWAYLVSFFLGEDAPASLLEQATAMVNSFRPDH